MKFKVGDTVKRCICNNSPSMIVGDVGIITKAEKASFGNAEMYTINDKLGGNNGYFLKLVNKINWRKRLENGK